MTTEEHIQSLEKAGKWYNRSKLAAWWIIALCLVAITIIVSLSQYQLVNIAHQNKSNTNYLIDCTTPKHPCYEQARSATTGAVGTISVIVIDAIACAKQLDHGATTAQIQSCVDKALAANPGPSTGSTSSPSGG